MKKKIAIMLVGLMCISATGCSLFGSRGVDMAAISTEDIFAEIPEEANVEGSVAADVFTNGLEAANKKDNITIKVSNKIEMGAKDGDSTEKSNSSSLIKLAKADDNKIGSVVIDNSATFSSEPASGEDSSEPTEEKSKITGYYSGDALYFITNDGDKVKEEMSFDDFMSVVNTYSLSIYKDCISKAACVEKNNKKTYYISYDPSKFETTMNTNMEASGQVMANGEAMRIKYANIIAETDNEDNLLSFGFVISAEYVLEDKTTPYNYSISAEFSDEGSTKVDAVKDTDSYMTAEEYTKMMQEKAAEEASASEDGAEANAETQAADETKAN